MPPLKPVLDAATERLRQAGVPGPRAVARAIAHELPGGGVCGVEKDRRARAGAGRTAAGGVAAGAPPITLLPGDIARPGLLADLDGAVDAVVGNPPYIPDGMES